MRFAMYLSALCLAGLLAGTSAQGAIYQILPVRHAAHPEGGLGVAFEMPCGTTFQGLVLNATGPSTLEVGALVKRDAVQCTGLSRLRAERLPQIDTTKYDSIETINPFYIDGKIHPIPTMEFRLVAAGRRETLQVVYASRCGRGLGVLVVPRGKDGVALSYVEAITSHQSDKPCKPQQLIGTVPNFRLAPGERAELLPTGPVSLEQAYDLRLTRILRTSLKRTADGGIKLRYVRRCNEAPVGLVTNFYGTGDDTRLHVGMLVARYYNSACPAIGPKLMVSEYQAAHLRLRVGLHVKLMRPTKAFTGLRIAAPVRYTYDRPNRARGLKLDYLGGCDTMIGAVTRQVPGEAPRIGILQRELNAPCKKRVEELSLRQPFFINQTPAGTLRVLNLVGA